MKNIIYILLFVSFSFTSEIKSRTIEVINQFYDTKIEVSEHTFKIPKSIKKSIQSQIKQKFYRNQIFYWKINVGEQTHYALMDNTIGKSMPITFLVIFNQDKEVIHSSIIKYREAYGGEISGVRWLAQFLGMKQDSLFVHGREIAGISGATLSVKSFTKGISKLSLLLPYVMSK